VSPRSRTPGPRAEGDAPDLKPLFHDLVRLETELWNAVEGRLRAEHGVTLPFFEFMQIIARTPGCRVQDIAAELSITVGGTSKIVDRIEAAGYCARQANPGDRRSSIVSLTASGKRLLPKITATVDGELRARLGQAMTERSLTELAKTLTRLRNGTQGVQVARKSA
jgi:MarR family transcriptional regulator, organic hydroperoxide resistance regulator